jgi:hypothetical protein
MRAQSRVVSAFLARSAARERNDRTDGQTLYFWTSSIARHTADGIELFHHGHATQSTMRRLNEIAFALGHGKPFNISKGAVHFKGEPLIYPVTLSR